MIEVIRQALSDLGEQLKDKKINYVVPKATTLQFDNCGEFKNKFMMAYCSLLVEFKRFDTIRMNFLIVGHTHNLIDQYFSVISTKIYQAMFIASPMALHALIMMSHKGQRTAFCKHIKARVHMPSAE